MNIVLKRGDTGIGIRATLKNENGNVDLTGATVLFLFGQYQINCGLHDPLNGVVNIAFDEMHTAQADFYKAELQVNYLDGRIETFPNDGYLHVYIKNDIGGN